jgi:protein-disulfide isomerase
MSLKRTIPIFLLLALVVVLAACQPNSAEESVGAVSDGSIAQTEQAADVDASPHTDGEAEEPDEHRDAEPGDDHDRDEATAEHAAVEPAAGVPEFVPPEPATLATDPESVAFAMGDPEAPVQIVEFTDYECPYCQRYALDTMPAVVENLVESGRVFYAVKDLPLDSIHPEARSASVAARCAGEQDAYLAMHDAIFEAQADWRGTGAGADAVFVELAAGLDLDVDAFGSCQAEGQQAANVQANVEEAMSLGVTGTPTFFITGYGVSGAQPYELFEMAVGLAESGELDDMVEAQARQAYEAAVAQQAAAQQAAAQPPVPSQPVELVEVPVDNAYAIGDPEAPVTIVEYTDFQCPFCARHALETFAQIEENLVETGQVRYVFKDLPLISIHLQAMLAAEASRCAGAQGLGQEGFMVMHKMLFEEQKAWSGQANAADLFAGYAAEIGLDRDSFAACLENHDFEATVEADMQEAMTVGITGTPAFLINGHLVPGALPYEAFEQAVETLITEAAAQPAGN